MSNHFYKLSLTVRASTNINIKYGVQNNPTGSLKGKCDRTLLLY